MAESVPDLIVKLLWLQIVTAPCYGLSVVVSSVLQAARRYDFDPPARGRDHDPAVRGAGRRG